MPRVNAQRLLGRAFLVNFIALLPVKGAPCRELAMQYGFIAI